MPKLMKMRITVETVALVDDDDVIISGLDGSIIGPEPDFSYRVLRETTENIPHEDIDVDMTEIKSKADLPYRWGMESLPFMGKDDSTIKQLLEEVPDEKQNPDTQRN